MNNYVYIRSEPDVWTVGFYRPDGKGPGFNWEPESNHNTKAAAAARVHYLNGGRTEEDQRLRERN